MVQRPLGHREFRHVDGEQSWSLLRLRHIAGCGRWKVCQLQGCPSCEFSDHSRNPIYRPFHRSGECTEWREDNVILVRCAMGVDSNGHAGHQVVRCSRTCQFLASPYFRITIVSMMRKIYGEEVSEEQVDAWVAEAEEGYDVEQLEKRTIGRPARGSEASRVVPVRLTDAELDAVMKRAGREHLNRSEAIRAALRDWARAG